jgi:succinate dehydrogenase / fumarate reductase cytochrome b subunit
VSQIVSFVTSSIGKKLVMAITGLLMIGFLITHMSANLLVIFDGAAYNEYSHALISNPLIYIAEFGLLALFVGHFLSGLAVTLRNRRARPIQYGAKNPAGHTSRKSLASTTMILSGIVLLVFVPLHILTFKFGAWYDSAANPDVRDLHRLVLEEFQRPVFVVWYLAALTVLGAHSWHGFGSAFESLGVAQRTWIRGAGKTLTALLWAGFCAVPIYVYFFVGGGS